MAKQNLDHPYIDILQEDALQNYAAMYSAPPG
jgi:hypothetical protein